jgi:hypothetical protein
MLLEGAALLDGAEALLVSELLEELPVSLLPQAAVRASADTTAVVAAILLVVRMSFLSAGMACVPCSVDGSPPRRTRMGVSLENLRRARRR